MLLATALSTLIDALSSCRHLGEAMREIDRTIRLDMPQAVVSVNLNATTAEDPVNEVQLQRVWTSHPEEYPAMGRKRKKLTPWTETLFVQGRVFVGEGREAVMRNFDDYALMAQLNLNSFINVPLAFDGRLIGTFNVFDVRFTWSQDDMVTLRLLALLAAQWVKPFPALVDRFVDVTVQVPGSPIAPAAPLRSPVPA